MNSQCDDQGVPCLENDYHRFDDVCKADLADPVSVHKIINESLYCRSLALNLIDENDPNELNLSELLSGLNRKIGIYHLWIKIGHCQDHDMYSLLCVYVGKGSAKLRVREHIKTKWPDTEMLYVTFYECENRIAKYLEQLFLDTYDFYLNTAEVKGEGPLYARWNEYRTIFGTELERDAELFYEKSSIFRDLFEE